MSNILITGDVHLGSVWGEGIPEDGDVDKLFGDFIPLINNSSLAITNLESPITADGTPIVKTGPLLKSSIESLAILKKAGFDLLTLANNHIMDYGKIGLESTFNECKKLGLNYVGAGNSSKEARQPFVTQISNKKIAILNIAENEFSTIGVRPYGANPMDPINNSYDILSAKKNADMLILIVHGGREHYPLPSPNFQKTLRFYANCGADAVIAHHTHCVSGYEVYNDIPIFYGLGNFLFNKPKNHSKPLWNIGLGVELILEEGDKFSFNLHPYQQCKNDTIGVKSLKGEAKTEFSKYLQKLNTKISDDKLLNENWNTYIESQKEYYKSKLYVKNKWLKKFVNRNLLPLKFFHNAKHDTTTINLIHCETHREILLNSLQMDRINK